MFYEEEEDADEYELVPRNAPPWTQQRVVRQHGTTNGRGGGGGVVVRGGGGGVVVRGNQTGGVASPPRRYYPQSPIVYTQPVKDNAKLFKVIGVVVDLVGQAVAAIMPLPAAPTLTGDRNTDEENMKRYHEALAKHAKADERIRTIARVARDALDLKGR